VCSSDLLGQKRTIFIFPRLTIRLILLPPAD
jgi:hypothetical protein